MTDARTRKLARALGTSAEVACELISRGLTTPALVRRATDEDLLAVPGVDAGTLAAMRARKSRVG